MAAAQSRPLPSPEGPSSPLARGPTSNSLAGPATTIIDLAGRAALPAFVDSHTHFHRAAIVRRLYLDFEVLAPRSIDDVVRHVGRRAAELPPGAWIQGDSLTAARLAEGRLPNRRELDRAAPGHPVVLRGIGKHVVVANSRALAAAGIDRATLDPPGGRIEHDKNGEPTGILHERAKLRLDQSAPDTVVPSPSAGERQAAVRAGFGDLHRLGITTIHEMVRLPEEADDFSALRASNELNVRVRLYYRIHEAPIHLDHLTSLGIRQGFGDDWLRVLGAKISVDGWCIFRNAAVHEAYLDEPDNFGIMRIEPDELQRLASAANRHGLALAIHAVGDRAIDAALDAFAAAGPALGRPYRLEHAHLGLDGTRLRRMRDLGVVWSVQPGFLGAYAADWERCLAADRIERILPLADAAALGIPTIHNSDVPSGPQAPLAAIRAAVDRHAIDGPVGRGQAVDVRAAWEGWTTLPHRLAGETRIGELAVGNAADLIVLDRDPLARTIEEASEPELVATMIDGRFVHGLDGVTG